MHTPITSQITPVDLPVVHWGVHFVHENVVSDYGPGDEAKTRAEETVEEWADSAYPAKLVSQTILPWTASPDTKVALVQTIQEAVNDPRGVIFLRQWLLENGYEEETDRKTGLSQQVPLIKQMRRAMGIAPALEALNIWLRNNQYESLSSDETIEMLREQLSR